MKGTSTLPLLTIEQLAGKGTIVRAQLPVAGAASETAPLAQPPM